MNTNLCPCILEANISVDTDLVNVLIHHKLTDTYEESALTGISEETKASILNGKAEVVVNKDLYNYYTQYTTNPDTTTMSTGETDNDVFPIFDSFAGNFKYFNPDYIYVVLEYNYNNVRYKISLGDIGSKEIEAVRCGKAKVVGNKDLFDSYLRQLSPMDIMRLFGDINEDCPTSEDFDEDDFDNDFDSDANFNSDDDADFGAEDWFGNFKSNDTPFDPFCDTTAIEIEPPVAPIFGVNPDGDTVKTDNIVDDSNRKRIMKYMQDNDLSNIYCLVLALMCSYVANGYPMELDCVRKIALHAMRKIHGFSKDDFDINKMYKKMVDQAVNDMDHLIGSLRYKIIPGDKMFTFNGKLHLHPAYTIFANIFANSYFNPYLTEEEDIGRSVELFDV